MTSTGILNRTRNTLIADKVDVADTPLKRMQGLMGRKALAIQEALVIRPCLSVHMLFMSFAIDVVFIDARGCVIGLCPWLKPFNFSPVFFKSACAIELPAGTIEKTNTEIGDQIDLGHLP